MSNDGCGGRYMRTYLCLRECHEEKDQGAQLPIEGEPGNGRRKTVHAELHVAAYQLTNHSATFSNATNAPTHVQYMAHRSRSGSESGLWERAFHVE